MLYRNLKCRVRFIVKCDGKDVKFEVPSHKSLYLILFLLTKKVRDFQKRNYVKRCAACACYKKKHAFCVRSKAILFKIKYEKIV